MTSPVEYDYLIVGAGFAGAVAAERLARGADKRVLVIDRRSHVGGNAFDVVDAAGILVHQYGPHIFHTNSADVLAYLSHFTEWREYRHRVLAQVGEQLLPIPINLDTVNRLYGWSLDSEQLAAYFASVAEPVEHPRTSEDVIVGKVGRHLYETFFQNYTRKQWGLDPSQLDASVTARVPVRLDREDGYFNDRYQCMPLHGYTAMFERMLSHPNITVMLDVDGADMIERVAHERLIYTGPIDVYFDRCFGALPYRSLRFEFESHAVSQMQPVAVINHPNGQAYTRVTEFTHLTGQVADHTTLVYEYPTDEGDPYYPIPRPENAALYERYRLLAEALPNVHFTGRLGSYRYFNMDQVVAQSLALCHRLEGTSRTVEADVAV